MLKLINHQDMEFDALFDTHPYTGPLPNHENPGLNQPITSATTPLLSPVSSISSPVLSPSTSSSSSILSSSPHLDALLGPPITRSSSTPDKTFQPPTFQQSPLAQVPSSSTVRQQPASPQQAQSVRQPKADQPLQVLSPSVPAQLASPHGSPPKTTSFSSSPQALFTPTAPQTPPQTQVQAQVQPQQTLTNYGSPLSYTGKCSAHSLVEDHMRGHQST